MKKVRYLISALSLTILFSNSIHAQDQSAQTLQLFSDSLNAKASEASLYKIAASYAQMKKDKGALDSLSKQIIKVYPKGIVAATSYLTSVLLPKAESHQLKIADVEKLKVDYPLDGYNDPQRMLGYYYQQLIVTAAPELITENNTEAFKLFANVTPNVLNDVAWNLAAKGQNLNTAEQLSKKSIDDLNASITQSKSSVPADKMSEWQEQVDNTNAAYEDTYANILYKNGKKAEALKYETSSYTKLKGESSEINSFYIKLLTENGQNSEALKVASELYVDGKMTSNDTTLKSTFEQTEKGKDYNKFITSLDKKKVVRTKENLQKSILNLPSHNFKLRDLSGKEVSLNDYKGKVVVLDFWATWCGPCKASFPGMQLAVDKYKNNKDVQFLFIDTWERSDEKTNLGLVNNFINDKKYTFHVLVDEKDGAEYKVVKEYGITGIPTKFILGKDQKIKFKMVGYSGSDDAVLTEVSNSIDYLLKEK